MALTAPVAQAVAVAHPAGTVVLALEPHLAVAGHSSGFSGPEGMEVAVRALRRVMQEQGCREA